MHYAFADNLRIPFFSWILRHLGGFFIKRKLDHSSGKDELYKCILQEVRILSPCMPFKIALKYPFHLKVIFSLHLFQYVEQLLQNGQYLEFYIGILNFRSLWYLFCLAIRVLKFHKRMYYNP